MLVDDQCIPATPDASTDGSAEPSEDAGVDARLDASAADASAADAEVDAALPPPPPTGIDWTTTRGTDVPLSHMGAFDDVLFGLQPTRIITRGAACGYGLDPTEHCDYQWRDETGAVMTTVLAASDGGGHAPTMDGRHLALLTGFSQPLCLDVFNTPIYTASFRLLDASTGQSLWSQDWFVVEAAYDFFSAQNTWAGVTGWRSNPCPDPSYESWDSEWRLRSAPNTRSSFQVGFEMELPDGRLPALVDGPNGDRCLALVDPLVPGGGDTILCGYWTHTPPSAPPPPIWVGADWAVFADTTAPQGGVVVSVRLSTGEVYSSALPPNVYPDRVATHYFGVCEDVPGIDLRSCTVHDLRGIDADIDITPRASSRAYIFSGRDDIAYYNGLSAPGDNHWSLVSVDLHTGATHILQTDVEGSLYALPTSPRALFRTSDGNLYLVDRTSATFLMADVKRVIELGEPAPTRPRQLRPVLLVSEPSPTERILSVWDETTGRLVHLTRHLYFETGAQYEFDHCGYPRRPYTVYPMPSETHLYFGELSPGSPSVTQLLVPMDLSEPPRSLGTQNADRCVVPFVSPDGHRVAVYARGDSEPQGDLYQATW